MLGRLRIPWGKVISEARSNVVLEQDGAAPGRQSMFQPIEPPARPPVEARPTDWWEKPIQPGDTVAQPPPRRARRGVDYSQLSLKHLDANLACPEESPAPRPAGGA